MSLTIPFKRLWLVAKKYSTGRYCFLLIISLLPTFASCADPISPPSDINSCLISLNGGEQQEIVKWLKHNVQRITTTFKVFFTTEPADYQLVRGYMDLLARVDTSDLATDQDMLLLIKLFRTFASQLIANELPSEASTLNQLISTQSKLRVLNHPSIRMLLENETSEVLIAHLLWSYNAGLYMDHASFHDRLTKIKAAFAKKRGEIKQEAIRVIKPITGVSIEVVSGDLFEVKSDATVVNVECDHLCSGNINSQLQKRLSSDQLDFSLLPGQAIALRAANDPNKSTDTFILVSDGNEKPLHILILNALVAADQAGSEVVSMPFLRSGHLFGAVEENYNRLINEIALGIQEYQALKTSKVKIIKFVVKNNDRFKRMLDQAFNQTRERSLRNHMVAVNLSGNGFTIKAPPPPYKYPLQQPLSPIYKTMLQPWSLSHLMEVHAPILIGDVLDPETIDQPSISVLNMPIKFPGSSELRIPIELRHIQEFLEIMLAHEAAINPKLSQFYAYLTVDYQMVRAGTTHRQPGVHIDGVQGERYKHKLEPEHIYSLSNTLGTVFYLQPFDLRNLDPSTQHVHAELSRQAREKNAFHTKNYGVYFWDSYSVHRADIATADVNRLFIRVEFSMKVYDNIGDTKSPLFDYNWTRVDRPIPAHLDDRGKP